MRVARAAVAGFALALKPRGARAVLAQPAYVHSVWWASILSQRQQQQRTLHSSSATLSQDSLPEHIEMPDGSILQKPVEPGENECCGRGCANCVWTLYTQDLQDYQAAVAVSRGYEAPVDPFEALERRLAAQTAELQDADSQGLVPPAKLTT